MLLVELTLDTGLLRASLRACPQTTVQWERSDMLETDHFQLLFWASGCNLDTFERALERDESLGRPEQVAVLDDRRLYTATLEPTARAAAVYTDLVERGGLVDEIVGTVDGWTYRLAFPDHESFAGFADYCRDSEVVMDLQRLSGQVEGGSVIYGLTPRQRDVLQAAIETGYLEIPRRSSLAELASSLGISENAASERFRRAVKTLTQETVYTAPQEDATAD
ncbi:helix-turn-helix domain-containing protein [Haloarchaeobius sp. TZWWS8]|uniref:helix-turn-helix domain-containing protein n=1 Tax=Haloarchaeobius sp. TZWWS8 TaxID=3446121 RepID=UPI003EBA03EF